MLLRQTEKKVAISREGHLVPSTHSAPTHSAVTVKPFLANEGMVEISQLLYSPDFASADFFYSLN
jgi:hypothetical protein